MALFKYFRSWRQRKPAPAQAVPLQLAAPASIEVVEAQHSGTVNTLLEPQAFPFAQAQSEFYQYLLRSDKPLPSKGKISSELKSKLLTSSYRRSVVPRLPALIPRLLRSLRDPDAAARDYADLVKKDPLMVATILQQANSVHYNVSGRNIENIDEAVVLLGVDGLRRVLSAAVMKPMILQSTPCFKHFGDGLWQHSLYCANLGERLAKDHGLQGYQGYLLGLCQGMGQIVLYSELSKQQNNQEPLTAAALMQVILAFSQELSALIVEDWKLPEEVCQALAAQADFDVQHSNDRYGILLYQANYLAQVYSVPAEDEEHRSQRQQELIELWQLPQDIFQRLENISL